MLKSTVADARFDSTPTNGFPRWLAVILAAWVLATAGTPTTLGAQETPHSESVFHGQVDISVINLYVTVVDRDGNPVSGLNPEDFEIFENGRPVELTNFSVVDLGIEGRLEVEVSDPDTEMSDHDRKRRHVAILLDLQSLQKRNRRRICSVLEDFVRRGIADGDSIMLATSTGELNVVHEFSDYEAALLAALRTIPDMATGGDAEKRSRRYLKRSIFQTDYFKATRNITGATEADTDQGEAIAQMTYNEIQTVRRTEYNRIARALESADELVRALAGVDGPKAIVWVGEDLALRPAYDIYSAFYRKTAFLKMFTNFPQPEAWAREMDLSREFERVAAQAQASGTSFHIIDASDRDREMNSADYSPPSVDSIIANEATGDLWTPGTDFADVREMTEGGNYLALATGGSSHLNSRNLDGALGQIRDLVRFTYSLGYTRPGPPDGESRSVQVRVKKPGLRVRHHEKVLNRSTVQELADKALSRARFNMGSNPLGVAAELGPREPTGDGVEGHSIRELQITMPIESLTLLPGKEGYTGSLLAAVAVLDGRNRTAAPRLMRLSVTIPADRYQPNAIASQTLQLRLEDDARRLAVGIQDEISGVMSTVDVALNEESPRGPQSDS